MFVDPVAVAADIRRIACEPLRHTNMFKRETIALGADLKLSKRCCKDDTDSSHFWDSPSPAKPLRIHC